MTTDMPDTGAVTAAAASFRDRQGRVYRVGDRVVRGLGRTALANFERLKETGFYRRANEQGTLIQTRRIENSDVPLPDEVRGQWAGFLEHESVPVITWPDEWSFAMLKTAALLQLDLLAAALAEDFTLKDATPYNVQFMDGRAVFIDIPSFEPLAPGQPWVGYRQFCEMYLFPLMLQAYKGLDFQPFMRASVDGVGLQTAAKLFKGRSRWRRGVTSHVWLQARLDRSQGGARRDVKTDLKRAGFSKALIQANVRKLRKLVAALEWSGDDSEWANYADTHNYSEGDHAEKERFVAESARLASPDVTWDVGANQGRFSKAAAPHSGLVLAMDIDHPSIDRLFLDPERPANVMPLLQNVLDPSPNRGWRLAERTALPERSQPDLVLCLALIHHVVISGHVPMDDFIDWLAGFAPALVIEFVDRDDDKVRALLLNKDDDYDDYALAPFEKALTRHFEIRGSRVLDSGLRRLYHCERRSHPG